MPKFEEHCRISMEKFGEDGAEYHKWIDQYSKYGYRHRQVLHHKEGVEVGVQLFGEKAKRHLEQHIMDDCGVIATINAFRKALRSTDGLKQKSEYKMDFSHMQIEE